MWNAVVSEDTSSPAPSARTKHSATLLGENVYVLGGRNGNIPLKDFWKYNLGELYIKSKLYDVDFVDSVRKMATTETIRRPFALSTGTYSRGI